MASTSVILPQDLSCKQCSLFPVFEVFLSYVVDILKSNKRVEDVGKF